ncbi:MAG: rod shape-determining protein MreD [Roseinatronobacter sp.]
MVERRSTQRIVHISLFLGLAAILTLWRLLPLHDYSGGVELGAGPSTDIATPSLFNTGLWFGPDWMLCLTLAWVVRRPDLLPAPIIAVYFLFEDLLLHRPPGLGALVVLLGTEFLRTRVHILRGAGFWLEYVTIAVIMVVSFLLYRLLLAIVIVPLPSLDLSFFQLAGNLAVYPVVVAVVHWVLRVRKPATGEVDGLGQKL